MSRSGDGATETKRNLINPVILLHSHLSHKCPINPPLVVCDLGLSRSCELCIHPCTYFLCVSWLSSLHKAEGWLQRQCFIPLYVIYVISPGPVLVQGAFCIFTAKRSTDFAGPCNCIQRSVNSSTLSSKSPSLSRVVKSVQASTAPSCKAWIKALYFLSLQDSRT